MIRLLPVKKTFQNIEVPTPTGNDDAVNKQYLDSQLGTKLDKIFLKDINLNNKQLTNLGYDINDPGDVVNLGFTDQKYLQKVSDSDLDMDEHRIKNSLEPVCNGKWRHMISVTIKTTTKRLIIHEAE